MKISFCDLFQTVRKNSFIFLLKLESKIDRVLASTEGSLKSEQNDSYETNDIDSEPESLSHAKIFKIDKTCLIKNVLKN